MSLLRWFSTGGVGSGLTGWAAANDAAWPWVTTVLSVSVAAGYCAIAVNWFFQDKLSRHADSRAALTRLRNISILCAAFGLVLYSRGYTPWYFWRAYDAALLVLAVHAWTFVIRTRGLGLVSERLKQFDELERSATKYREIAELLPHMVWTATDAGRIDFSNQRWHEYGGSDRTWVGSPGTELEFAL